MNDLYRLICETEQYGEASVGVLMVRGDMMALQRAMIEQTIVGGIHGITEDWTQPGVRPLRHIKLAWKAAIAETRAKGIYKHPKMAEKSPQAEEKHWDMIALNDIPERTVDQHVKYIMNNLPEIKLEAPTNVLMLWILHAAREVVRLDITRRKQAIRERAWEVLTMALAGKLPARYRCFVLEVDTESPIEWLETLIRSLPPGMVEEAVVLLKSHINTIANGDFWTVATQTREMVAIESMASFTNLANWTALEAPLHIIKSRLADIQALDIERRRQILRI